MGALEALLTSLEGNKHAVVLVTDLEALLLWPDRVVYKCAVDVELAERHGMRRFLWMRGDDAVWRRRMVMEQEIGDEVARRPGSRGG